MFLGQILIIINSLPTGSPTALEAAHNHLRNRTSDSFKGKTINQKNLKRVLLPHPPHSSHVTTEWILTSLGLNFLMYNMKLWSLSSFNMLGFAEDCGSQHERGATNKCFLTLSWGQKQQFACKKFILEGNSESRNERPELLNEE